MPQRYQDRRRRRPVPQESAITIERMQRKAPDVEVFDLVGGRKLVIPAGALYAVCSKQELDAVYERT